MTEFQTLDSNGRVVESRTIDQSDLMACPHVILVASHYREDGTCRCDDPNAPEMASWGYTWRDGRWC